MKNILLTLVLLISLKSTANCQSEFGLIGGINFAKLRTLKSFESINGSPLTSFHVGLVTDFRLSFDLYFQPQFLLSGKGVKGFMAYQDTISFNPFYLEIPLNFLYKKTVRKGNLLVGLGPYIAKAMFGKEKSDYFNRNIKFGNKYNDDVRDFDLGLNLIGGYEFKYGPLVTINYSLGVSNAIDEGEFPGHNLYLGISVGYFFGKSRN